MRAVVAVVGVLAAGLVFASSAMGAVTLSFSQASHDQASVSRSDELATYSVRVKNTGTTPTSGTTSVTIALPGGTKLATGKGTGWTCHMSARTCSSTNAIAPGAEFPELDLQVWLYPDEVPDVLTAVFTALGGGSTADAVAFDNLTIGPRKVFELTSLTAGAFDGLGADHTQAGGHPVSATSTFEFPVRNTAQFYPNGTALTAPVEDLRDLYFDLPAGFVGNPQAVEPACTIVEVRNRICPFSAAVGGVQVQLFGFISDFTDGNPAQALFRVIPERGYPAGFAFQPLGVSPVVVVIRPKLRSGGDYGITAVSPLPPQAPRIMNIDFATLCGYGANVAAIPQSGIQFFSCKQPGDVGANQVPFVTNLTECSGGPVASVANIDSWQNPGGLDVEGFPDLSDPNWKSASATSPAMTGCDQVPFDPAMSITPTSSGPDSASGLDVDLVIPQDGLVDPDGLATSHLKKTVVELPEGLTVNPSAAAGLSACTDEQMAMRRTTPPACPDGSKLGTVKVTSPLIEETLEGVMYLAEPKSTDPASGEMLRLWLSVRNDERGLSAKLPGSTVADPQTGRLTATFDENPRLPFDHLEVDLKSGGRGVLATPQDCGTKTTKATLSPWSGTAPVDETTDTAISGDCSERFAPKLSAGNSDNQGRGQGGTYSFKFSREDGEQWLKGLTATLPKGLLASVKDVPLCTNTAADAGQCQAGSKIGVVDAKAGAGDPFVLEEKGELFLTESYKGGEYGLAVKVRPVAGPFRGAMELSPIIVRQAIHVDRTSAQVTAISDPFPVIHHGVPLRVREVNVLVNRAGFMLNPSDCDTKQTGAALLSTENATANLADPFQVSGCANLAFKPKLALRLTGKRQVTTGKHPGIRAQVTQQGVSEAGIEKAVVRLPKSLALDVNNAGALCEFEDGTKPDLENHCPAGSIVGRARAKTPLLKDDLAGNVYFVKNVRKDPTTGNLIRTLPMIVVALRGEISINLKGESDTTRAGKLVNTFNNVPDAPVSQFNLNINGGNTGILAVTRTRRALINICTGRHTAEADMDGHNGRRHDRDIRMKTPCTKKQTKAAKRAAKRAAKQAARRR
jgi:hypothetical protein